MPFPIAAAVAGASLLGTGATAYGQSRTNKKSREWQEEMYYKQRQHAFQDWGLQNDYNQQLWHQANQYNEAMWAKDNEYRRQVMLEQRQYDSPEAQMARFKAAGINPHAMYNNMSGGASMDATQLAKASQAPSSSMSSSSPGSWNPKSPIIDLGFIQQILGARQTQVITDNLKKDGQIKDTEAVLKLLDVTSKQIGNDTTGMQRDLLKKTMGYSAQVAEQTLASMLQDYQYKQNEELRRQQSSRREQQLHPLNLSHLREQVYGQKTDTRLKLKHDEERMIQWLFQMRNSTKNQGIDEMDFDSLIPQLLKILSPSKSVPGSN